LCFSKHINRLKNSKKNLKKTKKKFKKAKKKNNFSLLFLQDLQTTLHIQ
jgi:uncharacterized membrane protein (DUF106 family)